MIVDSSVLVAMVLEEPEAMEFAEKLSAAPVLRISAVSLTESAMVLLSRRGLPMVDALDEFVSRLQAVIEPVDFAQAKLALRAFDRYGKGRHRAGLNMGDCFVYALAEFYDEPLLCKGSDFLQTDLIMA